jgi:hypothetical protein
MLMNQTVHALQVGHMLSDETRMVLEAIVSASFEFYQTGSRFFGHYDAKSDWDFFTPDSEEVRQWLQQLGFELESRGNYEGTVGISEVWKYSEGRVDIQLVNDVRMKHRVECLMRHDAVMRRLIAKSSREERKALWSLALHSYTAGVSYAATHNPRDRAAVQTQA